MQIVITLHTWESSLTA